MIKQPQKRKVQQQKIFNFKETLFVLLILFFFVQIANVSCAPRIVGLNKYFQVVSATQQITESGIAGGGIGSDFFFQLKLLTHKSIVFDSLWLGEKGYKLFVNKKMPTFSDNKTIWNKRHLVYLKASAPGIIDPETFEIPLTIQKKITHIIGYHVDGRRGYFTITNILKQSSSQMP